MTRYNPDRAVGRLREAGFSAAQAYALARLLADVRVDGFDRPTARRDLVSAGFTEEQADILIDYAQQALHPPETPA
jgi:hypothetical protein